MAVNRILFDFRHMEPEPPLTELTSGMAAHCAHRHMRTVAQDRPKLYSDLAREYNCSVELIEKSIREKISGAWFNREPGQWRNQWNAGNGEGGSGGGGGGNGRLVATNAAKPRGSQFRPAGSTKKRGRVWEVAQRQEQQQWRRATVTQRAYVELQTMSEVKASKAGVDFSSYTETTTSIQTLRRSTRTRFPTEKEKESETAGPSKRRRIAYTPASPTPRRYQYEELWSNSAPSPAPTSRPRLLGFAKFLAELGLERIRPILKEYGFSTTKDLRTLKNMSGEAREKLFEWWSKDKKVNSRELAILYQSIISEK